MHTVDISVYVLVPSATVRGRNFTAQNRAFGPSMSSAKSLVKASGANEASQAVIKAHCSDLTVQVIEHPLASKARGFDYVGSIKNHPQLIEEEKHSLLWLLAQSPAFHGIIKQSDLSEGHELVDWVKCTGMMGIHISRQDPEAPERVYKLRGVTEIPTSTEVGTSSSHSLLSNIGSQSQLICIIQSSK